MLVGTVASRYGSCMCPSNDGGAPVVEANPAGDAPDLTLRALHQRIRQQEILAELGVTALQGAGFDRLLAETARLTAEGLRTEFCTVLEHIPSENRLLVRAGVGWDEGIVGKASIGADLASPAGFALRTGKPVISNHLENEERFRTPEILAQHGIHPPPPLGRRATLPAAERGDDTTDGARHGVQGFLDRAEWAEPSAEAAACGQCHHDDRKR